MTEPLAWGVLGSATIARRCLLPAIQTSAKGRVLALGSRNPEAAADLAQTHRIPKVTDGYAGVVDDPDVEAVYIPLPNHLHFKWTLKALAAGKHVLCEKPLALSAAEAKMMADAARDSRRMLMEGLMYRFHPRTQRIKELVDRGRLGTLKGVRAAFCYAMAEELIGSGENFRLKKDTGGGALLDVGCYGVSTARWFFGREPIAVQAQADYHPNGVDQHFAGILKFTEGGLAVVEASFVSALQQTYTLTGSRAAVELPHDAYIPWKKETRFTIRTADQECGDTISSGSADEYQLMIEHFADAARGKVKPAYTPQESIRNMQVLDALEAAAGSGATVHLTPSEST